MAESTPQNKLVRAVIYQTTGYQCGHDFREILGSMFEFVGEDGYVSGGTIQLVEYAPGKFLRFWDHESYHYEWLWSEEKTAWGPCKACSFLHEARVGTFHFPSTMATGFTR